MCGITGYFDLNNNFEPNSFAKANNIIKHRGPDDFGYITINKNWEIDSWKDETLKDYNKNNTLGCFGFRRLSIIDLSSLGHQPMSDHSGNFWIVFNGEIYNYVELREELKDLGYKFISKTDTEVILCAYKEWGKDCLSKFNGMWSFSILDKAKKKLFCSRDRFGIKPFYYYYDKKSFAFGSEIKQILELIPNKFNELNRKLVFDFLTLGTYGNETHETYFKNIYKINPGSYLEVDFNSNNIKLNEIEWWDLNYEETTISENDIFERIEELFEDSVKLRLRSDVQVGTALSGGLDSSGIVSMVDRIFKGDSAKNKVFTMTSNDPEIDDPYYSNILVKNLKVQSFQKQFEDSAKIEDLNNYIWHQ